VSEALASWSQLGRTVEHARNSPGLLRFIVGRFFYTDPINTVIAVMSLFAINALGFKANEARYVLITLTVVAVLASFGWGWLVDRIGPRRTLLAVLVSWAVGLLIIGLVVQKVPFLVAGAILGSGLGGVAVTDRLLLIRLAPPALAGEMFGLYGLAGKLSAVIGPVLYGGIVFVLEPRLGTVAYQIAILSLLILMVTGFLIVRGVPEGVARAEEENLADEATIEPAVVPPGEVPP
jgi:UMF1 family MFS transporter